VVNELRGEKIDVIRWSPDPATNCPAPTVDECNGTRISSDSCTGAEDQLSLAIGKEQNVRLAARLTGWKIDIKDRAKYDYQAEDSKFNAR